MPRAALFVAAFAALLLVLVHPFCSMTFAGAAAPQAAALSADMDNMPPDTCCSHASDGAFVKPAGLPIVSMAGGVLIATTLSWIRLSAPADTLASPRLAVPLQRSYYARSARILR